MPSSQELRNIAEQAEKDLNSYQNKTGAGKVSSQDEAGVDTRVEQKFPGAEVRYDQDLSTNAGFNKTILPEEGGELDSRGRPTRGEHFEGHGGPEHKLMEQAKNYGGYDQLDSTNSRRPEVGSTSAQDTTVPYSKTGDALAHGKQAVESNIAGTDYKPRKDAKYGATQPQGTSTSISAEGYEAPSSVVEGSREAYQPEEFGTRSQASR